MTQETQAADRTVENELLRRGFSGARIRALLALDLDASEQTALAQIDEHTPREVVMQIVGAIEESRKASVDEGKADDGE